MGTEIASNRKAFHNFHVLERFEAGLQLRGTEVKSVRAGLANLSNAFVRIEKLEAFLYGLDIQPYERASHEQHESKRPRRLLMHRAEILKLQTAVQQQGCALPALRLYWKGPRVKVEVAIGKGKSAPDKRESLKRRVNEREADRQMAAFNRRLR